MYREYAHRVGVLGGAYEEVLVAIFLEEIMQFAAVGVDPVAELVHEGLDVEGLTFELMRVLLPEAAEDFFTEVRERMGAGAVAVDAFLP